jgi:hypothetical protein
MSSTIMRFSLSHCLSANSFRCIPPGYQLYKHALGYALFPCNSRSSL